VKLKPVLNDLTIRKACAMAINRQTYWKVVGGSSGVVANGIYKPTSRFYDNPGYPAYNPSGAKALVNAYKAANNVSTVGFVLDIVAGNSDAQKGFGFLQQQLSAIGITVTPRPLVQSALIANVIYGMYDCATWNQFGGVDPAYMGQFVLCDVFTSNRRTWYAGITRWNKDCRRGQLCAHG
jgi:ABC-type transport system substrate-binding protein